MCRLDQHRQKNRTQVLKTMQSGFTLIELMVCVAIIGILAAIAIPTMNEMTAKARCTEVTVNFASYERLRLVAYQENGRVNATLSQMGMTFNSQYFDYSEEVQTAQADVFSHSGTAAKGSSGNAGKVDVCHIPPGNPENAHVINISNNAYDAHVAHGDKPCAAPAADNSTTSTGGQASSSDASGSTGSTGASSGSDNSGSTTTAGASTSGSTGSTGAASTGASASNSGAASTGATGATASSGTQSGATANSGTGSVVAEGPDLDVTLKATVKKFVGSKCTAGMGLYTLWQPSQTARGDIGGGTCTHYMGSVFAAK